MSYCLHMLQDVLQLCIFLLLLRHPALRLPVGHSGKGQKVIYTGARYKQAVGVPEYKGAEELNRNQQFESGHSSFYNIFL